MHKLNLFLVFKQPHCENFIMSTIREHNEFNVGIAFWHYNENPISVSSDALMPIIQLMFCFSHFTTEYLIKIRKFVINSSNRIFESPPTPSFWFYHIRYAVGDVSLNGKLLAYRGWCSRIMKTFHSIDVYTRLLFIWDM